MKARFTQAYVNSLKLATNDKPYWISDEGCQNLRLYVGATGKIWYALYRDHNGKKQSLKIGPAAAIAVTEARNEAIKITARVIKGEELKKEQPTPTITYGDFLTRHYAPWVVTYKKTGKETVKNITSVFGFLFPESLESLSLTNVENWRMKKIKEGRKAATVNRYIVALTASLNWAVKHGIIKSNPLASLEKMKERDSDIKVRYLSAEERNRLMTALNDREKRIRDERKSHNAWLIERGLETKPELNGAFADYLKPMVLVSLYTGIRRGSLFGLKWSDIDFFTTTMTIRAENDKPEKTHRFPMNSLVVATLKAWREQSLPLKDDALIFPSPVSGEVLNNVKKSWVAVLKMAGIENFRWHDMRHDFASQLVMKGVDLNTVRELMGHADTKMTMRYAHLAPDSKLKAVEVLSEDALETLFNKAEE